MFSKCNCFEPTWIEFSTLKYNQLWKLLLENLKSPPTLNSGNALIAFVTYVRIMFWI